MKVGTYIEVVDGAFKGEKGKILRNDPCGLVYVHIFGFRFDVPMSTTELRVIWEPV